MQIYLLFDFYNENKCTKHSKIIFSFMLMGYCSFLYKKRIIIYKLVNRKIMYINCLIWHFLKKTQFWIVDITNNLN